MRTALLIDSCEKTRLRYAAEPAAQEGGRPALTQPGSLTRYIKEKRPKRDELSFMSSGIPDTAQRSLGTVSAPEKINSSMSLGMV